jgi:YesN/AraC family two-component response regulator
VCSASLLLAETGLLEAAEPSADEISADVGYQDPAFFRRLFRRHTGMTPIRYRRMFQHVEPW